jgi:CMP-N,N'-diacetyllegionaminic acid synthase
MLKIKKNTIYALVPIKEKSKRIKSKNFIKIKNKHLFEHTLTTLQKCKFIDKIYLSTDSQKAAKISEKRYKIKIPFMRPKNISQNLSDDKSYIFHFLSFLKKEEFLPEYIMQMRVTTPFRDIKILKDAISLIKKNPKSSSLRSTELFSHPIEKVFSSNGNYYQDYKGEKINNESFNKPSQYFKNIYKPNGYVDILKTKHLLKNKNIYGNKILKFVTPKIIEIDDEGDINLLKKCHE